MFSITTSATNGTPATLAKAMARQVTPQRLLATIMDGRHMWAVLTLPEGVTVRGTLGGDNVFAEFATDAASLERRVQTARETADGAEPEPVYTSTLPLRRVRWEAVWEVHHADGPSVEYTLHVNLSAYPGGLTLGGWLEQRPVGTDLPDTALAPRFRRGQIYWSASLAS